MINRLYNYLFQNRTDDSLFWKKNWNAKIELYKREGVTDLEIFSSSRYYEILFKDISDHVKLDFKGKNVLEFGAGTGILSLFMAARGANVYLLDVLPEALQYASILEKRLRDTAKDFNGTVTYLNSEFTELSENKLYESFFDIVHNAGVIEEYDEKSALLIISKMKRLTADGGSIFIGVPNFFNPYLIKIWIKYGKGSELYFNRSKLKRLIRAGGFDKIHCCTTSYVYPFKKHTRIESFMGKIGLGFLHIALFKK